MTTHLKSFDLVGKKEDVSDFISLIDPTDTPFQSSIKDEKVNNTLYQWQEDQLRAVAKNAKVEGLEAQDSTRDQPVMRSNGTQILEETFRVSGTAEAVKTYGRDKQTAREMMKTGKLLKMDLEHSLVGTGQTYVEASAGTPGEFAGVQAQIATETTTDAGGALTEAHVIATHEKMYNEGSDASVLMVKPSDTVVVAGWASATNRTLNVDHGDKKLSNVINIYEDPFGTVRVVKNRLLRATDALMYEAKNWKLAVLRNWFRTGLAKTGDSDRHMMVGEFGLKHSNRKASGLIKGLS
ncbi:DUF5309 family protein [Paracoccus sp. (in: a-proteobacteria)]|uniref:SU10 major capsid protein n=1 Tax=Paracoccus sp. TaxID=267 RepID=UPI0026DEBAA2|nr:DUF5309 family protein [Paracoccus sp. (in: a-proteobacteria)]MDO5647366.1 DUF5309 family protein [Paracoccus sp. (in: a-proteobacteria)]